MDIYRSMKDAQAVDTLSNSIRLLDECILRKRNHIIAK